jgi:hypothetical protein
MEATSLRVEAAVMVLSNYFDNLPLYHTNCSFPAQLIPHNHNGTNNNQAMDGGRQEWLRCLEV